MTDYIKLKVIGVEVAHLLNCPLLDFNRNMNDDTAELSKKHFAKFEYMKILTYDTGFMQYSGSIHKSSNNGTQNYNDFTMSEACKILYNHSKKLEVNLFESEIKNLEFGVNLILPFKAQSVVDCLMLHVGIRPDSQCGATYKQFKHTQFILKIYNKGVQYGQGEYLLRIELKFIKSNPLHEANIYTMGDLLSPGGLNWMKRQLMQRWQETVVYDFSIDTATATHTEMRWDSNVSNPNYWYDISPNHRDRPKRQLKILTLKYGEDIKSQITTLLSKKIDYLCNN